MEAAAGKGVGLAFTRFCKISKNEVKEVDGVGDSKLERLGQDVSQFVHLLFAIA